MTKKRSAFAGVILSLGLLLGACDVDQNDDDPGLDNTTTTDAVVTTTTLLPTTTVQP